MRPRFPALAALALVLAAGARAESSLLLPLPEAFGAIDAGTFDAAGQRLGPASMTVVRRPDGRVELGAETGIEGGARSSVGAVLALAGGSALRLLSQRSESFDLTGASLGALTIDHEAGRARCGVPAGSGDAPVSIELPANDRVVNVPLNLLFQRLVNGEESEVAFQVLLCRFGARLLDARARVATPRTVGGGLVEVRYQLDLGPLLSTLAAPFLPTLSFWFDPDSPGAWVAHRMPLYTKGPTVLVVRSGFSPERLAPSVGAGP